MKKLFLMTIALLSLGAAVAMAQDGTFNIAYNVCRIATTTGTSNDQVGACDGSDAAKNIIATFQPTSTAGFFFGGTTCEIAIEFSGGPIPDAWDFSGTGCNSGGLKNANVANLANCGNPYFGSTQGGGEFMNNTATRVNWGADWGRATTPQEVLLSTVTAGAGGYLAQKIAFAGDIASLCAGCDQGACIVLNRVIWGSQTSGLRQATAALNRGFITWNGGGTNCPGATPTKSSTWGQVKSLYR